MANGSVNLPAGYALEAPQQPPAPSGLPPGYQVEGSAPPPVATGGSAPLSEAEAKADQSAPGGSYASSQAAQTNAPSKDPNHVRFKASDGSLHDVPKEQLTKAMQIDPKLQITDWPTVPGSQANDPNSAFVGGHPYGGGGQYVSGTPEEIANIKKNQNTVIKAGTTAAAAPIAAELAAGALPAEGATGAISALGRLAGRAAITGAGAGAGEAAGQLASEGKIDPEEALKTGAAAAALEGGVGAAGQAIKGVKNLVSGTSDVSDQGLKDLIKTASGAKKPDVVDTIHSVLDRPKMFSTVENELKLAKPKIEAMKDAANEELENLRNTSTGTVSGAKQMVHQYFDDMIDKSKGVLKQDQVQEGIHNIRDFVTSKLQNEDMSFKDINDVKRAVADEIKRFETKPGTSQVVNTLDKSEQEALGKVRGLLETIEQKAEPLSKDVNGRLSNLIDTSETLNKKFPTLDTAEKAEASHAAGQSEAKKSAVKKAVGTIAAGGAGAGATLGGKAILDHVMKP